MGSLSCRPKGGARRWMPAESSPELSLPSSHRKPSQQHLCTTDMPDDFSSWSSTQRWLMLRKKPCHVKDGKAGFIQDYCGRLRESPAVGLCRGRKRQASTLNPAWPRGGERPRTQKGTSGVARVCLKRSSRMKTGQADQTSQGGGGGRT